jgi:hypothetical protein
MTFLDFKRTIGTGRAKCKLCEQKINKGEPTITVTGIRNAYGVVHIFCRMDERE